MTILVIPTGRANQNHLQPDGYPTYEVEGQDRAEVETWLLKHYDADVDTVKWLCDHGKIDERGLFYVEVDGTDEFLARLKKDEST